MQQKNTKLMKSKRSDGTANILQAQLTGSTNENPHAVLHFDKPADIRTYRLHGMPLGNGRIGAMVNGDPELDFILLNHDRLRPNEYHEREASVAERLPKLRELVLAGKWQEAQEFFDDMKTDSGCDPDRRLNFYHPAAYLILKSHLKGKPSKYHRTLDLTSAVGCVQFDVGEVSFERTYFVSSVDGIFVTRIAASKPGHINIDVSIGRLPYEHCKLNGQADSEGITLTGHYPCGLKFVVRVRLKAEGGSVNPTKISYSGLGEINPEIKAIGDFPDNLLTCEVRGANALTISTTIEVTGDPLPKRPGGTPQRKYDTVDFREALARHSADHQQYMGRMALHLGQTPHTPDEGITVPELIEQARRGEPPLRLCELVFDMGRYVLLASSRPGSEPVNLQGVWNESYRPVWQCRYQLDMNLQMSYWLANLVGLHECNLPFFDLIDSMVPAAERFARDLYGCRGILFPVGVDGLNVRYHSNLEFTGNAGWLAQHYWEHYQFTLDREFLAQRAYPFIKRVAVFYEDFLFKGNDGRYLIIPSNSPENDPHGLDKGRISMNATIDIAIAKEVLTNASAAAEILGLDEALRSRWQQMADDLPDWPIGQEGELLEWGDPSAVPHENHRGMAHLYPLFPGQLFTPEDTPELVEAAVKAIQKRENGFREDACGWSYAWITALYARAARGEDAYRNLSILLKGFISPETLLSTISDISGQGLGRARHDRLVQVEAGLGATAAMTEMLVQSHAGLIRILPALPQAWSSGKVQGVCARGGFTVDVEWADHRIRQVRITSIASTTCRVKLCQPAASKVHVSEEGKDIPFQLLENGLIEFSAAPGKTYLLL